MNGKIDSSKGYIIITPCKNEEGNLPSLINSITSQTITPTLWVIIDDGSTDNTPIILKKCQYEYDWIKTLRLEESNRDLGLHLAKVMKIGFNQAVNFCEQNRLEYHLLGNVDADLTLPPTFYENLNYEFEKNPKLGIASGGTDHIIGGKKIRAKLAETEPSGGHMLIRKECFEQCGGIPQSYSMDSVIKAKARLKGWETRRFEENIAVEIRDAGNAEGYLKGFMYKGEVFYCLNYNPLHVILKSTMYFFRRPYYGGIIIIVSYLKSYITRKDKIRDAEIRCYFWNKWKERVLAKLNGER